MMMSGEPGTLADWETFYVIVGSAGGALTGLLFVVVALVADRAQTPGTERAVSAYTTPSIFHFVNVLAIAALMTIPRRNFVSLAVLIAVCALVGLGITTLALLRMRQFEAYAPVAEDWIWHGGIPGLAYIALLIAAIELPMGTAFALDDIATVTLALLLVGIHNAWDVALYSAVNMPKANDKPK